MNLHKLNLAKLIPLKFKRSKPTPELIPVNERIMNKLTAIEHFCLNATYEHFDFFRQIVVDMINGIGVNINEIESIVSDVTTRIAVDCAGLSEVTHNSVSRIRDAQVQTLKDGFRRLEDLQPPASTPEETRSQVDARNRTERSAIQRDHVHFQKSIAFLTLVSGAQTLGKVLVYNMLKPGADALRLSVDEYPTCSHIRRYLQVMSRAKHPDMWIRHHQKHALTPGGFLWEWLPAGSSNPVRGKYLDFFDRPSQCGYIIALRYVREEMEESPTPLELVPLGAPCCEGKCRNLEAHLHSIWSRYRVVKARKIQDDSCVLEKTFDDNLFDARTNNLFIELTPNHMLRI